MVAIALLQVAINLTKRNTTINFNNGAGSNGESKDVTVNTRDKGISHSFVKSDYHAIRFEGPGKTNNIHIRKGTNWANITGGANKDNFTTNHTFSGILDGGAGNDTFTINTRSFFKGNNKSLTLIGGAGEDTVTLNSMRLSDFRDSNGDISHAKFKVTKTPEGRYQIQDMRPNGSTIIIDPSVEHIRMGKDKLTPLILESLIKPEPNPLPPAPPSEYLDTINVDTAAGAMQFGVAEENQVDNPMLSQADMTALATTIETTPHNMGPDYPALPNLFKYLGSVSTDLFAKLTALVDDGENTSDKVSEADLRALANLDQTDNTEGPESQTVINITKKDFDALIAQQ